MIVTSHAIDKFRERAFLGDELTNEEITKNVLRMFEKAKPYEPPVGFRVVSLINHNYSATSYFRLGEWIFIVCDESIVTLYKAGSNLKEKPKRIRRVPVKGNRRRRR